MSKIDELMATEVMGLKIRLDHREVEWYFKDDEAVCRVVAYSPTTDMNQAMECVEKWMLGNLNDFEMEYVYTSDGRIWRVTLRTEGSISSPTKTFLERDKSAPLAICKAILKAKGVDYEQS